MYLKYIEIHGFKSFPDKIRIGFEQGFTAIVGPNGSGKSNISDAVRWVLGEQSSKSLRGGKMEDVIFGGTQQRNAMGFASVTLCLGNDDGGRIPDVGDELSVSRRYYRSGDSEYLINGATVRLRDVRELFMDTGLGRDGYSIIGQGKIQEIVSAKSTERREIFEEASGIAKYRFRKNEAGRKLEAAEDNISRIKDILGELEGRVGPLEVQMKKAKEYLRLADEKRGLEITLYCDTIERSRDQVREQDGRIAIAKSDYDQADARINDIYNTLEHNSELTRSLAARIDEANAEINTLSESIAAAEADVAVLRNDIEHNEQQLARLEQERGAFGDEEGNIGRSIEAYNTEIAAKRDNLAEIEKKTALENERLQNLILDNEKSDRRRLEVVQRLADYAAEMTDLRVSTTAQQSTADTHRERVAALAAQQTELDARLKQAQKKRETLLGELAQLGEQTTGAENRKQGFLKKRTSAQQRMDELAARLHKANFAADECEHRIKTLRDLDRSMDGFAHSVKHIMAAKERRELRGVIGTVASLIEIEKGCDTAVEVALGAAAQNIVVEDERSAKDAIAYLKENRAGRATFLPVETIKPRRFDGEAVPGRDGVVGVAATLVKCDEKYRGIVENLLGNVLIVEDIDAASRAAKRNAYRYRTVSLDGQVVNAGGSYTGGFIAKGTGLFTRRGEIERLEKDLAGRRSEAQQLEEQQKKAKNELMSIDAELTAAESELVNFGTDRVRLDAQRELAEAETDAAAAATDAAVAESEQLKKDIAAREQSVSAAGERLAQLERLSADLGSEQDDASRSGEDYAVRRNEIQEGIAALKMSAMELQKDIERIQSSIALLNDRSGDVSRRAAEIERQREEFARLNEEKQVQTQRRLAEAQNARETVDIRRAEIEECIAQRTKKEWENTSLRNSEKDASTQREELGKQLARLEERKLSLDAEYDRTLAKLWEEYELTKAEAEKLCVPFENITELRRQVGELRSRIKALGNVNVGAIEEYTEVSERYDFLKKQYDDVNDSRSELIKLIGNLTQEMQVLFERSFTEINKNFRRIFAELFGGGAARLYLSDESDVLECGIELDVQPPGKLIKNLSQLSGGEQTLVAIAIYFSILAVNPSPFCILDEIDTALDDANVNSFANYLRRIMDKTQFIAITHRRGTMEAADVLYGVTMQEKGVSKVLKLDISEVDATLVN